MGKPTGFMDYQRMTGYTVAPLERIKNFKDFKGLSDSSKRASLDLQDLKSRLEELEMQKQELKDKQNQIVPSNGIV